MILRQGHHLAYCTNIHRGETWAETMAALENFTLAVRARVCPAAAFGIGLWLSDRASRELISEPDGVAQFRRWLEAHQCYVFTLNGFPFGRFHGERVKESVYLPDWTTEERVIYTNRLLDILAQLLPAGVEGTVSTLPGAFKEFVQVPSQARALRANLFRCVEHAARLSERNGPALHLALEPEPLCLLENVDETIAFFGQMRVEHKNDPRLEKHLGINYDTCHMAVEYEEPASALRRLREHGISIKKLHLSSALQAAPTAKARAALWAFAEDTYLHQVIARSGIGPLTRYKDLTDALDAAAGTTALAEEWRVHFHIPLHCPASDWFTPTTDHLLAVLDALAADPGMCRHLEMETYTWEALPPELKSRHVVDQLAGEYEWTLARLQARGLA
ncbi:MAG TPA: metabolite traffic protein EboE [Verrucomicrobiae bacterium]|nr:metabolite traffic protein EboE [Verrucomicrobiae bacterium]